MSKQYDVVAVVGEYTNSDGEAKKKYQTVGAIIDNGKGPYLLLERWFNPSGLPNPEDRTNVLLSLFSPKEKKFEEAKEAVRNTPGPDESDEIPF